MRPDVGVGRPSTPSQGYTGWPARRSIRAPKLLVEGSSITRRTLTLAAALAATASSPTLYPVHAMDGMAMNSAGPMDSSMQQSSIFVPGVPYIVDAAAAAYRPRRHSLRERERERDRERWWARPRSRRRRRRSQSRPTMSTTLVRSFSRVSKRVRSLWRSRVCLI